MRSAMLVIALSGCSFISVRGPGKTTPPVRCTGSGALPILIDAAGAFATLALGVATAREVTEKNETPTRQIAIGLFAVSAVFTASAIYGVVTVDRCRQALTPPIRKE